MLKSDRIWITLSTGHSFAGNALHMPIESKEKKTNNTYASQFLFSGHKSNHHPENEHFLGFNNCWVNSARQRQLCLAHNFTHIKCVTLHLLAMSLQDIVNRINLKKQFFSPIIFILWSENRRRMAGTFLFWNAHEPLLTANASTQVRIRKPRWTAFVTRTPHSH